MDSILTSIKKLLGITEEYEHFDADIIMHINTVFSILQQLGAGDPNGFMIFDKTSKWSDFIVSEDPRLNMIKTYMFLKVRQAFDPPQSGTAMEALKRQIDELEWRINIQVDPPDADNTGYDVVTATDEEIQDLIDDLDTLGPQSPFVPSEADQEEIDYIKENLDDLDPCETATGEEVEQLIDDLDNIGPGEDSVDGYTASDEDIENLIKDLDELGDHQTASDEEIKELVENLDGLGGKQTTDSQDEDPVPEQDEDATQEDIDALIGELGSL